MEGEVRSENCPYCGGTGWYPYDAVIEPQHQNRKFPSAIILKQTPCVCDQGRENARRAGLQSPEE